MKMADSACTCSSGAVVNSESQRTIISDSEPGASASEHETSSSLRDLRPPPKKKGKSIGKESSGTVGVCHPTSLQVVREDDLPFAVCISHGGLNDKQHVDVKT